MEMLPFYWAVMMGIRRLLHEEAILRIFDGFFVLLLARSC